MIDLRIAITHYPTDERTAFLERHLALLDYPASVHIDRVGGDRLNNYRSAWNVAATEPCSHLLVLSDDMEPCPRFIEHLTGAIRMRPSSILCLFTMRTKILLAAKERGWSWITGWYCAWGGAMLMPAAYWNEMAAWERAHVKDDGEHQSDDVRINLWTQATRKPIWLTAPTLLQHVGAAQSTIPGHSNKLRLSPYVADENPINWDTPVLRGAPCKWSLRNGSWLKEEA